MNMPMDIARVSCPGGSHCFLSLGFVSLNKDASAPKFICSSAFRSRFPRQETKAVMQEGGALAHSLGGLVHPVLWSEVELAFRNMLAGSGAAPEVFAHPRPGID